MSEQSERPKCLGPIVVWGLALTILSYLLVFQATSAFAATCSGYGYSDAWRKIIKYYKNVTGSTWKCQGSALYRCKGSSSSSCSKFANCRYGCKAYKSGCAYCRCYGGRYPGQNYCGRDRPTSSSPFNTIWTCEPAWIPMGHQVKKNRCSYSSPGCYTSGGKAYCPCSGGLKGGQGRCLSSTVSYTCPLSTASSPKMVREQCRAGGKCSLGKCSYRGCQNSGISFKAGEYRCSNSDQKMYQCVDGSWVVTSSCRSQCATYNKQPYCNNRCGSNIQPGQYYCSNGKRTFCKWSSSASGTFGITVPCSRGVCSKGLCVLQQPCTFNGAQHKEGSTRCDGNKITLCKSGSWTTSVSCTHGCYVDTGQSYCKCLGAATKGQEFCSGAYRQKCIVSRKPGGEGQSIGPKCYTQCYTRNHKAYCTCRFDKKEGENYCYNGYRYKCTYSALGHTRAAGASNPCGSGQVCQNGQCRSSNADCTHNGQRYTHQGTRCDGFKILQCHNGSWSTLRSCQAGESCQKGQCVSSKEPVQEVPGTPEAHTEQPKGAEAHIEQPKEPMNPEPERTVEPQVDAGTGVERVAEHKDCTVQGCPKGQICKMGRCVVLPPPPQEMVTSENDEEPADEGTSESFQEVTQNESDIDQESNSEEPNEKSNEMPGEKKQSAKEKSAEAPMVDAGHLKENRVVEEPLKQPDSDQNTGVDTDNTQPPPMGCCSIHERQGGNLFIFGLICLLLLTLQRRHSHK